MNKNGTASQNFNKQKVTGNAKGATVTTLDGRCDWTAVRFC